jgi:predicted dinucleotide-binding enzyme
VAFGDAVMISVPWRLLDDDLGEAGPLDGKVVIDTTNQFGIGGLEQLPNQQTAAR